MAGLATAAVAVAVTVLHTALHAILDRPDLVVLPAVFVVAVLIALVNAFTLGAFAIYLLKRYRILSLRNVLLSGFAVGVIPWSILSSAPSVTSMITAILWCGSLGTVGALIWWHTTSIEVTVHPRATEPNDALEATREDARASKLTLGCVGPPFKNSHKQEMVWLRGSSWFY